MPAPATTARPSRPGALARHARGGLLVLLLLSLGAVGCGFLLVSYQQRERAAALQRATPSRTLLEQVQAGAQAAALAGLGLQPATPSPTPLPAGELRQQLRLLRESWSALRACLPALLAGRLASVEPLLATFLQQREALAAAAEQAGPAAPQDAADAQALRQSRDALTLALLDLKAALAEALQAEARAIADIDHQLGLMLLSGVALALLAGGAVLLGRLDASAAPALRPLN